jgi:hypothetical protein
MGPDKLQDVIHDATRCHAGGLVEIQTSEHRSEPAHRWLAGNVSSVTDYFEATAVSQAATNCGVSSSLAAKVATKLDATARDD